MNAFKKTQALTYDAHVFNQDNESEIKVGDTVRFPDQWRQGVMISGIVTEVGKFLGNAAGHQIRVRPVTSKGIRREFYTSSAFVKPV